MDTDLEMIGKLIGIGYDPGDPPIQVQCAVSAIVTAKKALNLDQPLTVMECLVRAEMMLNRVVGELEQKWPPKEEQPK